MTNKFSIARLERDYKDGIGAMLTSEDIKELLEEVQEKDERIKELESRIENLNDEK